MEAGLRSFDRSMPEEINRLVTDQLADFLFTPSEDADLNLRREGVAASRIHRVGNVMIDSLVRLLPETAKCSTDHFPGRYALVTLHRPSSVDNEDVFKGILATLVEASRRMPVIFPTHPRTRHRITDLAFDAGQLRLLDPLPYIDFLALQRKATVVITDSGGIQEETTYLGVPCLTVRDNTERPVTVSMGTNTLVGQDAGRLAEELAKILENRGKQGTVPPLWDGHASDRIADCLAANLRTRHSDE